MVPSTDAGCAEAMKTACSPAMTSADVGPRPADNRLRGQPRLWDRYGTGTATIMRTSPDPSDGRRPVTCDDGPDKIVWTPSAGLWRLS